MAVRRRVQARVGVGVEGLQRGGGDEEIRIVVIGEDVVHSGVVVRGRAAAATVLARTCGGRGRRGDESKKGPELRGTCWRWWG